MNASETLKQAWKILVSYRLLWIFGFILALTTTSWESALLTDGNSWQEDRGIVIKTDESQLSLPSADVTFDFRPEDGFLILFPDRPGQPIVVHTKGEFSIELPRSMQRELDELGRFFEEGLPPDVTEAVIGSLATISIVILVAILLATVFRYVAEAAIIKAVDDQATSGKKAGLRRLLRWGWSVTAWRFFLIDLVVRLPLAVIFFALFLLAFSPLLLWVTAEPGAAVLGTIASAGLFYVILVLALVTGFMASILTQFFRRVCALEGTGVTTSIVRGFQIVWRNLKDVAIMTVFMIGASLGWVILLIPASLVLIPVILLFVIIGGLTTAAVVLSLGGLASLLLNDVVAWVLAGSVGLAIFIPIVGAPFFFLGGLLQVFKSSSWTLTYRQLAAMEKEEPETSPKVALAGV